MNFFNLQNFIPCKGGKLCAKGALRKLSSLKDPDVRGIGK